MLMSFNNNKKKQLQSNPICITLRLSFNCSLPQAPTLWPQQTGSAMFWLPQQTSWCSCNIQPCLSIRQFTQLWVWTCWLWAWWAPGSRGQLHWSCGKGATCCSCSDKQETLPTLSLLFWVKELFLHFTNVGVYFKPYRQGWYEFIFPTKLLTLIAAEKSWRIWRS